jgi:predicted TIM-barrel fold metal-dependent hydrolase
MKNSKVTERLQAEIDQIPIVDTHEHILPRKEILKMQVDLFALLERSYLNADLVSAGMPVGAWEREGFDPRQGWERIKPFISKVRNTAYYQALLRAFRDLYGFADAEINEQNWEELSDRISAAAKREDWYRYVLKEKANIDVALLDLSNPFEAEREFFVPVLSADPLLYGYNRVVIWERPLLGAVEGGREELERQYGVKIRTFDDYLSLIDLALGKAVEGGAVALKVHSAYRRILRYEKVSRAEAEKAFIMPDDEVTPTDARKFQDHFMHLIIGKATEYGLPLQIHTGIQHGHGNTLWNSNPLHLNNLFLEYGEARFVLFHGGYPFTGEMAVLAKNFPNVYLDFCWLPLISPEAARRALSEWIETVPGSKLAWGGDCRHVEECYGHVLYAKEVVSEVLGEKVENGYFSQEVASDLARMIFRENAWQLYGLDEKRNKRGMPFGSGFTNGERLIVGRPHEEHIPWVT